MSEDKIYKILGVFVSKEEKCFGGVDKYMISYKQPNSQDPARVWKHGANIDKLSDAAVLLIDGASEGERFCIHQGKDGQYPLIVDVTDAKDVPVKDAGRKPEFKSGGGKWQAKEPKDETGIAVGAAWTNAIEITKLANTGGQCEFDSGDDIIKYVDRLAGLILNKKLAQEAKLRAAKAEAVPVITKGIPHVEQKLLSRAEQLKANKATSAGKQGQSESTKNKKESSSDDVPFEVDSLVDDDLDAVVFD